MNGNTHHVLPHPQGGWKVVRGGAARASRNFETKSEAVEYAREVSRNQKTELLIHDTEGKIRRAASHGNDPFPPRDRR